MTIAEFLIELKVKGADKATAALKSVKGGLTDISAQGLAAKAAIVGVVYAVEKLTIGASQLGTNLVQFSNYTGLSAEGLQRWQIAMMQSGVTAEETQKNIENVQQTMGKFLLGEGQPAGYGVLAQAVGLDITKVKNAYYVASKMREYLHKDPNVTRANEVASSFGFSPAMIQALRTTNVELEKIANNEILSDNTKQRLNGVNIAWMNFWRNLKLLQANLVADYGIEAIKALRDAFRFLVDVVKDINDLIKAFPLLKYAAAAAGAAIALAFAPVTSAIAGITLLLSEIQKFKSGDIGHSIIGGALGPSPEDLKKFKEKVGPSAESPFSSKMRDFMHGIFGAPPSLTPSPGGQTTSMNIKIDNHGVEGADQIQDTFNTAVNFAFRQMQSATQVA